MLRTLALEGATSDHMEEFHVHKEEIQQVQLFDHLFWASDDLTRMMLAISKLHSTCVLSVDVHNIGYDIDQIQKAFVFSKTQKNTT